MVIVAGEGGVAQDEGKADAGDEAEVAEADEAEAAAPARMP